jgi:hypothetical protein
MRRDAMRFSDLDDALAMIRMIYAAHSLQTLEMSSYLRILFPLL